MIMDIWLAIQAKFIHFEADAAGKMYLYNTRDIYVSYRINTWKQTCHVLSLVMRSHWIVVFNYWYIGVKQAMIFQIKIMQLLTSF